MRLRLALAIASSVAAGGCEPATTPAASPPASKLIAPAAEPRQDLPEEQRSPDLFGAWLVQKVAAPGPVLQNGSWDMILLVGARQLQLLSQCVTIGPFEYGRTVGGGIVVRQTLVPPRAGVAATPAPVQCARAFSPTERPMPSLLLKANKVTPVGNGAVMLSGPGGAVTLRRPTGPLRNPRGEAPPPRVPPLLGAWRFVNVGGRTLPASEKMELLLRPAHLEWRSGCVSEMRGMRIEGDILIPGDEDPFAVCERGRTESETAVGRLFAGKVAARMAQDGRLRLQGSGVIAELDPLIR